MKTNALSKQSSQTAARAAEPVRYTLQMPEPASHLFEVTMELSGVTTPEIDLRLPVWRPGRYSILDMAGTIETFAAADGRGKALSWQKVDKSTWRVTTGGAAVVKASYTVFADEFRLRTRGLNESHGFVDGSGVFMYADAFRNSPVVLRVQPYKGWHVTTGLEGSGREFHAPDYDWFIDCPLEIGTQKDVEFKAGGKVHVLSIAGEGSYSIDTLVRDMTKLVEAQQAFWGEIPYGRYVFMVHCEKGAGGGTEHVNSTIMGVRPEAFETEDGYRGFLGLVSHEFFHTWNVKQLRPAALVPYDYTKENYLRELWIAEGTTSYYDELLLQRSGLISEKKYLSDLAGSIRSDRSRPGNAHQSLTESSFDVWVKHSRGLREASNVETDFYSRGALVSFALDMEIRRSSRNGASLDSVLREMYRRFPRSGPGYTVDDLQAEASKAAGPDMQAMKEMKRFFDDHVHGAKPLPWEDVLASAGLKLVRKDSVRKSWIGMSARETGGVTTVSGVVRGSPAKQAGLDNGDEIVAVDGKKPQPGGLSKLIEKTAHGKTMKFTIFRNDALRVVEVKTVPDPVGDFAVEKVAEPDSLQKSIYESWLKVTP